MKKQPTAVFNIWCEEFDLFLDMGGVDIVQLKKDFELNDPKVWWMIELFAQTMRALAEMSDL